MNSRYLTVKTHCPYVVEPLKGKDGISILKKGLDVFKKHGYTPNIGAGTLLGLYRDNKLIDHDTDLDIDLCIDNVSEFNQAMNNINGSMELEGFKLCYTQSYAGKIMQTAYYHEDTKIIFDVYYYYMKFDWYMNVNEHGMLGYPKVAWNHTEQLDGMNIPKYTIEYLEQRYGVSWNVPQNAKSAWEKDAENLMVVL